MRRILRKTMLGLGFLATLVLSAAARAQATAESQFERAFFLETHENDLAGAAAAYERVAADPTALDNRSSEAKSRLMGIQEDLASAELARLMPPEVIAYVQLSEPGEHVTRLLKMMGLLDKPP